MIKPTEHLYVVTNDSILDGEPIVKGTLTTVREVAEVRRQGVPVEKIPEYLPQLTLAQVFSALGYFSDHQAEIKEYIVRYRLARRAAEAEQTQSAAHEEKK